MVYLEKMESEHNYIIPSNMNNRASNMCKIGPRNYSLIQKHPMEISMRLRKTYDNYSYDYYLKTLILIQINFDLNRDNKASWIQVV